MTILITLEGFLSGHGGYRPGSGRKGEYGQRQRPVSMFLSQDHYAFLSSYPGVENVSDAARALCEKYASVKLAPRRVRLIKKGERVHTSITLPNYMRDYLMALGKGSVVSGLRLLIEMELLKQNK